MRLCSMVWVVLALAVYSAQQTAAQCTNATESRALGDSMCGVMTPNYPPLARAAKIQGTVLLKVKIDKSGVIRNVYFVSGHPLLVSAAIDTVKHWKYKPYLLNGSPADVETTAQVNYKLDDVPTGQTGVANPTRVRVSKEVMRAFLLTRVNPAYPAEAKTGHIDGIVDLRVNIDKDGNLYNVDNVSGPPLLIPAAIEAVKQWKYKPYLLNQQPVEVETTVEVNFTLVD